MMSTETAFPMPSSVFDEGSFLENQDLFSLLQSPGPGPSPDPACSNSGSGVAGWAPTAVDERKRRRMMSNRESARRSRMRRQRHLEDLRNQVHRLGIEKRVLASRLALCSGQCHLVRRENVRLLEETVRLRRRFSELQQGLIVRQLQEIISSNEQIPHLVA